MESTIQIEGVVGQEILVTDRESGHFDKYGVIVGAEVTDGILMYKGLFEDDSDEYFTFSDFEEVA